MEIFTIIWQSIVLGTVQGLTEFLPVSSSGHLVFLQKVMGYDIAGGGMTFVNVMLHLGTLLAVVFVFRKDILALFRKPFTPLLLLIVATIPAGLVGVLFDDQIDALFKGGRALLYLAVCFSATALMLLVCEIVAKRRKKVYPFGWRNAVPMGLLQAVALLPGVSRSGSTIVAGTLSGAKTEDVAKFSFLMSIPIILGSVAVELLGFIREPQFADGANGVLKTVLGVAIGVVFAAMFGFFAIKVMLKIIGKANYKWFSLYLILLSMTCIWLDVLGIVA